MIRFLVLSGVAALFLATNAPARAQPATSAPSTSQFITAALQTDNFERQAGRLAQTAGRYRNVRSFGGMMVTDHTKTTADLRAAIMAAGLPAPPADVGLSADQEQMLNSLRYLVAMPDFDATYIDQQVKVHQQAQALMQAYSQSGDNAVLRNAATNTLPIVQRHLMVAQEIKQSLP